jgi:hypothetical protein
MGNILSADAALRVQADEEQILKFRAEPFERERARTSSTKFREYSAKSWESGRLRAANAHHAWHEVSPC